MHTLDYHGMPHRRMGHSGLWVSEVGLGFRIVIPVCDHDVEPHKKVD